MRPQLAKVGTKPYKKFQPVWIVRIVNTLCRWATKTQKNRIEFLKAPSFSEFLIFTSSLFHIFIRFKGIFEKIMFQTRERMIYFYLGSK